MINNVTENMFDCFKYGKESMEGNMKRKISISLLAIFLILSLVSCEGGIVGLMGKMGQNVAGVDSTAVANKVNESVSVSADDEVKAEKKSEKATTSDEKKVTEDELSSFAKDIKSGSSDTTTKTTTTTSGGTIKVDSVEVADGKTVAKITVTESKTVKQEEESIIKYKNLNGETKNLFTVKATTSNKISTDTTYTATSENQTSDTKIDKGESKTVTEVTVEGTPKLEILGIEFKIDTNSAEKLLTVESILPPADLSAIKASLDGNSKEDVKKQLAEKVTDETTKQAVEGTATLLQVMLDSLTGGSSSESDSGDKGLEESSPDKSESIVSTLKTNLNDTLNKDELTNGDVIALKAVTNVITSISTKTADSLSKMFNGSSSGDSTDKESDDSKDESSDSDDDIMTNLMNDIGKEAESTLLILNEVSSTSSVFKGVDVGSVLSMFNGGSKNSDDTAENE